MLDISDTKAVSVVAATHPLKVGRVDFSVPVGLSVADIFESVQPDAMLRRAAHIYIGDHYIEPKYWAHVYPKSGAMVSIRAFVAPRDGDTMRSVLMIAVTGAALAFGGPLAGMFGFTGSFGAAIGQAIIGIGGMLAVNALIPPRDNTSNSSASDAQTNFIENGSNQADPFGVVPDLFGRIKVFPKLAANSYTEIVGDTQFLNMLLVWGIGPISLDQSTFKIGETLLSEFSDVQIENREGYDTDTPLTLFPSAVNQDNFQIALLATAGYTTRTSGANADRIGVDVLFPNGLLTLDNNGNRSNRTVAIKVQYSVSGANDWKDIPVADASFTFPSSWTNSDGTKFNTITVTQKRTNAIRHGFTFKTPARGQYDIRIERLTADTTDDKIRDAVYWAAIRAFTNENPINSPVPVAVTALRIRATDQLNGVVDQLSGIPEKVCLDWDTDTSTWIVRATQNPASLFRYAMQSGALQVPYSDDAIDLTKLAYWHEFCEAQGFEYNELRDQTGPLYDVLADIAAGGRASPTNIDGKWSVVIDEPKSPVSHITPRNSKQFEANKAFLDRPHAVRVQFSNEEQDYRTDELRVYLDGYDETTATKFETASYPGITKPSLITKHARFAVAVALNRPEQFTFMQDMERLVYRRGDVILLTHDVLLVGLASGRIKSVILDGSDNATGAVVDVPLPMRASVTYGMSIRNLANIELIAQLVTDEGEQTTVTFATPIDAADIPAAGDLFGFGIIGQETDDALIIDIDPQDLYDAQITAVPYREVVYDIDAGTIPSFDSRLTPIDPVPDVIVESVRSDETALTVGSGESLSVHVAVKVQPLPNNLVGSLDIQIRPSTSGENFANAQIDSLIDNEAMIADVRTGEYVDVRLRWLITGRLPGAWTTISTHRIVGKSTDPDPLQNLTISTYGGQAFFRWDAPRELDVIFGGEVRFRHSADPVPDWSNSTSIGQAAQARSLFATLPLKAGTYLARVYDEAGNQSTIVTADTAQASVLTFAPVDTIDEASSFTGVKDNTILDGIQLKIGGAGNWDDIPDVDATADIDGFGGASIIQSGEYTFATGFDFLTVKKVRITLRILAGIFAVNDTIDTWNENIDTRTDFDGENIGDCDCIVYVRMTNDDPGGSPTWGAWQRLDSMEIEARGCQFKAVLTSQNSDFNIGVTELGVDAEEVA